MLTTLIIILLVLTIVGAYPGWPHSSGWGPAPSGFAFVVLVVFLILYFTGRIHFG